MTQTVTRTEIVDAICKEVGLTAADALYLLEGFLDEIMSELAKGRKVTLSSFGSFSVRRKKERQGRNPKTGTPAIITARSIVSFSPSANLKNRVVTGNK